MSIRPMLAADISGVPLEDLSYPLMVSPKLDGLRCVIVDGVAFSRNGKPIPNKYVQRTIGRQELNGLDGELIVGDPQSEGVLGRTQSGVRSVEGEPDFRFWVFDDFSVDVSFADRLRRAFSRIRRQPRCVDVQHDHISRADQVRQWEEFYLESGFEGLMLRDPYGRYKYGRSTLGQGGLLKLKRFTDGEGIVTGLEPAERNDNPAFKDELGRTKRSTEKAGRVAVDMVGTLLVSTEEWGELRVAPGIMTHDERRDFWAHPEKLLRQRIHWRSFGYGIKDKPRFARYYGLRDD